MCLTTFISNINSNNVKITTKRNKHDDDKLQVNLKLVIYYRREELSFVELSLVIGLTFKCHWCGSMLSLFALCVCLHILCRAQKQDKSRSSWLLSILFRASQSERRRTRDRATKWESRQSPSWTRREGHRQPAPQTDPFYSELARRSFILKKI